MSIQQEIAVIAPLDTPKTALAAQLAILAELRKQTALMRSVAEYAEHASEEKRVEGRRLEFKKRFDAVMSAANCSLVAAMSDPGASAQTRIDAARALVSAATTAESGEQSRSSVPESQDAPP